MTVYLGCYADEAHPNGLKALELDEATGALCVAREYPASALTGLNSWIPFQLERACATSP